MPALASMTGFAGATARRRLAAATIEIKSVNSRFLDLTLRIADELRQFEPQIREQIGARVVARQSRVSVDAAALRRFRFDAIEQQRCRHAATVSAEVQRLMPAAAPLSVAEVLAWPGTIETPGLDLDAVRTAVLDALAQALDRLQQSREREGAALAEGLRSRCVQIDAIVLLLRDRLPELRAAVERKLTDRLNQALAPRCRRVRADARGQSPNGSVRK